MLQGRWTPAKPAPGIEPSESRALRTGSRRSGPRYSPPVGAVVGKVRGSPMPSWRGCTGSRARGSYGQRDTGARPKHATRCSTQRLSPAGRRCLAPTADDPASCRLARRSARPFAASPPGTLAPVLVDEAQAGHRLREAGTTVDQDAPLLVERAIGRVGLDLFRLWNSSLLKRRASRSGPWRPRRSGCRREPGPEARSAGGSEDIPRTSSTSSSTSWS